MVLIKKHYISNFTTKQDIRMSTLDYESSNFYLQKKFEDSYIASGIDNRLMNESIIMAQRFALDFKILLAEDRKVPGFIFQHITSVVGDDEITTTDSKSYGPVSMIAGEVLSGIKLSRRDCGLSNSLGNYAEGWILMPITIMSDFHSVQKYNSGRGVPVVLDPIKLKQLSAVRKQSELDVEFTSKYGRLNESVGWVNNHWFTYSYHQVALIFATCIFDFRSSDRFPYLYKEEGGVGGEIPFDNIDSAMSALFHFNRGKSARSIVGAMREATDIQRNNMEPSRSVFLKASYLAQIGGKTWDRFESVYRTLASTMNKEEVLNLLSLVKDEEPLPEELNRKGIILEPKDALTGVAVSHLRNDGLILTDMDVKIMIASQVRTKALLGTRPYELVLKDLEDEKTNIKSNPYTALSKLYSIKDNFVVVEREAILRTLRSYYQMKKDGKYHTSFSYADHIKLFKAQDVKDVLQKENKNIRTQIISSMAISKSLPWNEEVFHNIKEMNWKMKWLAEGDFTEKINGPIPDGIGPDDSRVVRNILEICEGNNEPFYIMLFTGDTQLILNVTTLLKRRTNKQWAIIVIPPYLYMRLCLRTLENETVGNINNQLYISFYNYITEDFKMFPASILENARRLFNGVPKWYRVVDFPNIERSLINCRVKRDPITYSLTIEQKIRGFLNKESIRENKHPWPTREWEVFKKSSDFHIGDWNVQPLKRDLAKEVWRFKCYTSVREGDININDAEV
jgi:hypothetical protein